MSAGPGRAPGSNTSRWSKGSRKALFSAILQDRQGFLWFGTEDGLNRYDGYSFTVFKPIRDNPNSLTHNQITALLEDRDGLLWIGTSGGGLDRFDPKQNRFDHYPRRSQ